MSFLPVTLHTLSEFCYITSKGINNNSYTSSTPIDLYEIALIFYTRIIHNHCLRKPTGYIYIYIYIYIYTNLISTSIHGTRKKQKNPGQEQEIKVSRITAQGKKKKNFGSKRKKRPTSSDPLTKIKGYAVSGQKKKTKKPSANPAMLQLLKCSTQDNGANYRINLNRESKIFY